jgi:hypothetical protein
MSTKRTHARTRFDAPPRHPREAAEERIVAQLAERMRAKLAQRRHHGDWREMAASTVMDALRGEVEELRNAFFGCCDPEDIISEAVDVAAYCAILIDVLSMEGES